MCEDVVTESEATMAAEREEIMNMMLLDEDGNASDL
jgi:hypothetical protein